jgi:hypothetical protein
LTAARRDANLTAIAMFADEPVVAVIETWIGGAT